MSDAGDRHLPRPALIESYGDGGFRFGDLSHRGSVLCLPNGIWAIPPTTADAIGEAEIDRVIAAEPPVEYLLIGAGMVPWPVPEPVRARLRQHGIVVESMTTGAAVRTWNLLLVERRRVGAVLIAVD
ncbi:hypothetical protein GJ689_08040 [Rhodoplanes serenus]|uniref:Mth938-like domain-containing protein n=1 Tax=Rhodoplanes serenus TaxID=200615 RepID=A0A9X5ARB0_9BRAD|nr:hypothetical protein [Rhodoplanes serenus]